jgi:iron(III) transport system ATP-binding protein
MRQGVIAQWDTPYGLHTKPADTFVADFIRREALVAQRAQAYLRGEAS